MASTHRLDGAVGIVTGSTRGIGWACANALADRGATLVLNGRSDTGILEDRTRELQQVYGVEASGILFDVGDDKQVTATYRELYERHRRLDFLVNNAGVLGDARVGMITEDLLQGTLAVNTAGAVRNLQAAARLIARSGGGCIVNVSSIVGLYGNVGQIPYATSKAAIVGLTKAAAKEFGPHGIHVNAVAPGLIRTDMSENLDTEEIDRRTERIALGRMGEPDDVADVVTFLCSGQTRYITGQVISVDGGWAI